MNAIFHRTSIRRFEDKAVEQEKIEKLLRAAMQSPTAGNQQSWQFYVIRNKETLSALAATSPYAGCAAKAPAAIVIAYDKDVILPEYNEIDCAIAAENIMLEAVELGLGSVILGIAPEEDRMKAVESVLQIPETQHAFTIIPIGYPKAERPQQDRYNEEKIHYID